MPSLSIKNWHSKNVTVFITYFLFYWLFSTLGLAAETPASDLVGVEIDGYYVINLASSLKPFTADLINDNNIYNRYLLYTTQIEKDGKTWHRLRLGFFPDMKLAENIKQTYLPAFAQAWVAKSTMEEKAFAAQNAVFPGRIPSGELPAVTTTTGKSQQAEPLQLSVTPSVVEAVNASSQQVTEIIAVSSTTALSGERLELLIEEARQAMASADYARAVQIYTRLLEAPPHKYTQVSQEYLGLARERKGQIAHAKAEYEKYLQLYPEGEGAVRVRQRLQALITAYESTTPATLREVKSQEKSQIWETYGNFSQYYRRDMSYPGDGESQLNQSLLSTDIDYTARKRNDDYELRTRFSGGYDWDFIDTGENEYRITTLSFEGKSKHKPISGIFGRQSQSSGGVLGRFDGLVASYGLTQTVKLNLITGMPVEYGHMNEINTDKYFYGVNLDLGTYHEAWDFNAYYIAQQVNNISDREAIGLETRYFYDKSSYYNLIDYDISYQVINTFFLLGNWTLQDSTNINMIIDRRKSPILTTSNALQGQMVETINELGNSYTEDELRQLAEDRTPDSDSYTLSITHPLDDRYQISGDFSIAQLSGTPASGGVPATDKTDNDYYMSLQLMASNLWRDQDFNILSLRYADTSSASTTTLQFNSRFPLSEQWRINPLLQIDYREFESDNSIQWIFSPALRAHYRWRRETSLEFELFTEWSSHELADETETFSGYYFSIGYRHEF